MAQNKLSDLNNHLFTQLERLGEEDLEPAELKKEIARAKAISNIAKNVIENAKTALEGVKLACEYAGKTNMPEQFKLKEIE